MVKVFLCHSSLDKTFVLHFAKNLEEHGVECWIDEAEMLPGDSLISKISEAIEREDFVLAFISKNSVESHWVKYELEQAMTKEITVGKVVIIPIKIDECDMPGFLEHKIYANFTDPSKNISEFNKILKAIGVLGVKDRNIEDNNKSSNLKEKVKKLQDELFSRFSNISGATLPVNFNKARPIIFLCMKPVNEVSIPVEEFDKFLFYPIQSQGEYRRLARGEYIGCNNAFNEEQQAYVYVKKDGYIETLNNRLFMGIDNTIDIPSQYYELQLLNALKGYLTKYSTWGVALPILLYVGLFNILGLPFALASELALRKLADGYSLISEDNHIIPNPIIINDYSESVDSILKPAFDEIWQVFGFTHSMNYNDEGKWVGQERFRR